MDEIREAKEIVEREEIRIDYSPDKCILLEKTPYEPYGVISQKTNVTFKTGDNLIFIGTYYSYDYRGPVEELHYNSKTIALTRDFCTTWFHIPFQVFVLFDIESGLFIEGTEDDLLAYYNQQFGNNSFQRFEKFDFQRKLLIRKQNKKS